MASREEMISFLKSQPPANPSRDEMISFLKNNANQSEKPPWYQVENPTAKGYVKGALGILPTAGMIAGGIAGTPADLVAGPMGNVAGAAAGGALGKTIQNMGEQYLLGENKTRSQLLLDPIKEAGSSAVAEMGGQVLGAGLKAAAATTAGKVVGDALGNAAAKIGETFTGVPDKVIKTYAKYADEIKAMAKASDNETSLAADQLRSNWGQQIQSTRQSLSSQISNTLKSSTKTIEVKPITEAIEAAKTKINPNLYPEQIAQIDDLVKKISSLSEDGFISVKHANDVKGFLQDQASSAYKPGGIFSLGTESAKAAKSGAAVTRKALNEAEPVIANANNQLAHLHDIEDGMNMNMLKEGKPEASIVAAGSGGNSRNLEALKELSNATNGSMASDAEKLAAMKTFGSPKLMAADTTGKAAGRMGLAAGLGYLVGNAPGAVVATALTSPAALKVAIDAGKMAGSAAKTVASSPVGQSLMGRAATSLIPDANLSVPGLDDNQVPLNSNKEIIGKTEAPAKGPAKWIMDGASNIKKADSSISQSQIDELMKTPQGKDLLIQASDLKPGSKGMDGIMKKIRTGYLETKGQQ